MAQDEGRMIEVGDVVRLRCGGPNMIADKVMANLEKPFAACRWFDRRGALHTGCFHLPSLERARAPPPA